MTALATHQASPPTIVRRPRDRRHVLVLALDPAVPDRLADADVLVVAPARNTWLRHWVSDEDSARRRAEGCAAWLVARLRRTAAHVEGRIGDADPLLAIADALATFPADEIVVVARPDASVGRVEALIARARDRFPVPVDSTRGRLAIAALAPARNRRRRPVSLATTGQSNRKGTR